MDFDYIVIDLDELLHKIISAKKQPVVETDLLRFFFPDYSEAIASGVYLDTFKMHFVLYHYLHKLRRKLITEKSKYYIHIKYIYIYILKFPEKGLCRFFNEELESFCKESVINNSESDSCYCDFHSNKEKEKSYSIDFSDIGNYYLDFDNYYKMDEDGLEKTLNGVFKYVKSKSKIEESLDILSVNLDTSFDRIHERYIYLSKKYHPDINREANSNEKYSKINSAYQVIKDFFDK